MRNDPSTDFGRTEGSWVVVTIFGSIILLAVAVATFAAIFWWPA